MNNVRTRFAPSPTGYLHVGGIRTALFAWLIAKQSDGKFILRLEDTDKKREVKGSAEHLMESLRALGIEYDEGPDIGGPNGPYRQSERLESYQRWAKILIADGRAYADPYSSEEVQAFRELAQREQRPFLYRDHRPAVAPEWDGSQPLRFKSNPKNYEGEEVYTDAVMGELVMRKEAIDDFVLIKSDGYPTYNFSHIIDDLEMQITHIVRGQEFISSTPNYLNLYEALGIQRPIIATVPHILGESGNKKLGKRDGAKDVLDYIRDGYLPEALVSFIATLGWNDGTEQEVFTMQELIDKFSLNRVQKSGARFDDVRLRWVNGHFIRNLDLNELYQKVSNFWPQSAENYDDDYRKRVLSLVQERLKFFAELPELTDFFFEEKDANTDLISSHKQLKKLDINSMRQLLEQSLESLATSDFSSEDVRTKLNELLVTTEQKPAVLFSLIRIVTTWSPSSPELADSLSLLGKDQTLARIEKSLKVI